MSLTTRDYFVFEFPNRRCDILMFRSIFLENYPFKGMNSFSISHSLTCYNESQSENYLFLHSHLVFIFPREGVHSLLSVRESVILNVHKYHPIHLYTDKSFVFFDSRYLNLKTLTMKIEEVKSTTKTQRIASHSHVKGEVYWYIGRKRILALKRRQNERFGLNRDKFRIGARRQWIRYICRRRSRWTRIGAGGFRHHRRHDQNEANGRPSRPPCRTTGHRKNCLGTR